MPFETIDRGILALREQAKQACSSAEDAVYIPLMGKYFSASEATTDLDAMTQAFIVSTNPKKICVLFGDGGSGKSFFLQQLTLKLWNEYEHGKPIPLFVSLPLLKDPIHSAVEETLLKLGFDRVQMNELKRHHSFVFIFDGYDELHQLQNLYVSNRLSDWDAKTIMSCRSQYLYNKDHPNLYFMPIENECEQPHLLQTLYVAPFNETQIEEYLAIMLSRGKKITDYAKMVAIPGLHALITTPFLLTLAVEALPEILERYATSSEMSEERHRLTQTDLYKSFVRRWFERQEEKLKKSGHITSDMPDQKEIFWRYCQALALEMHQYNLSWLNADDERFYVYFENDAETERLRSACPIKKNDDKIGFWHQSLGMYFIAQTIQKESHGVENNIVQESKADFVDIVENIELERPKGTIHLRLVTDDPAALRDLADEVERDPRYKSYLFDMIEHSKINKYYAVGAANAISALNAARVCFTGMNLKNIRVPNANLSGAFMPGVNLSYSDLTNASLDNIVLTNANLSEANLLDARFLSGESVVIIPDRSEHFSLSPDYDNIAAYTDGQKIIVVRLNDGYIVKELQGHDGEIYSLSFGTNGLLISAGDDEKNIRLWDIKKPQKNDSVEVFRGHTGLVTSLAFREDGIFASGSNDKSIRLWNTTLPSEKACVNVLSGHTEGIYCLSFSKKNILVSSGREKKDGIRLWDISVLTQSICLKVIDSDGDFALSKSGTMLASYGAGIIFIWDISTPADSYCLNTLSTEEKMISSLVFRMDGYLVSGNAIGGISLWDPKAPSEYARLRKFIGHADSVDGLAFGVDKRLVSHSTEDGTMRVWNIQLPEENQNHQGLARNNWVEYLSSTPGVGVIFGCTRSEIGHWDAGNYHFKIFDWSLIKDYIFSISQNRMPYSIAVSTNGIIAAVPPGVVPFYNRPNNEGGSILHFWDSTVSQNVEPKKVEIHTQSNAKITYLTFSPEGKLVIGFNDGMVSLCSLEEQFESFDFSKLQKHDASVSCLTCRSDGMLVSAGQDGIILHNLKDNTWEKITSHNEYIGNLAFGPRQILASACRQYEWSFDQMGVIIRLWNVQNLNSAGTLKGHTAAVQSFTFTPDGQWLVSGSCNEIFCWNTTDLEQPPIRLPFASDIFCIHENYLSIAHHQTIYSLDLTKFPNEFHSVFSLSPDLWLDGCCIENTKGLLPVTEGLFKRARAIRSFENMDDYNKEKQEIYSMMDDLRSKIFSTTGNLQESKIENCCMSQDLLTEVDLGCLKPATDLPQLLDSKFSGAMTNRVGQRREFGYTRLTVAGDGNCGYTALRMTREQALQLLTSNAKNVVELLQLPTQQALLTEGFYTYLIENRVIKADITHESITGNTELLNRYAAWDKIQQAYINYDVRDTRIDAGYEHPRVLQALAHIQGIELHIWRLGDSNVLTPHVLHEENYAVYRPENATSRVDLLYVHGNHFERLDFSSYGDQIPEEGIYPLDSSWRQFLPTTKEDVKPVNGTILAELKPISASANLGQFPGEQNGPFSSSFRRPKVDHALKKYVDGKEIKQPPLLSSREELDSLSVKIELNDNINNRRKIGSEAMINTREYNDVIYKEKFQETFGNALLRIQEWIPTACLRKMEAISVKLKRIDNRKQFDENTELLREEINKFQHATNRFELPFSEQNLLEVNSYIKSINKHIDKAFKVTTLSNIINELSSPISDYDKNETMYLIENGLSLILKARHKKEYREAEIAFLISMANIIEHLNIKKLSDYLKYEYFSHSVEKLSIFMDFVFTNHTINNKLLEVIINVMLNREESFFSSPALWKILTEKFGSTQLSRAVQCHLIPVIKRHFDEESGIYSEQFTKSLCLFIEKTFSEDDLVELFIQMNLCKTKSNFNLLIMYRFFIENSEDIKIKGRFINAIVKSDRLTHISDIKLQESGSPEETLKAMSFYFFQNEAASFSVRNLSDENGVLRAHKLYNKVFIYGVSTCHSLIPNARRSLFVKILFFSSCEASPMEQNRAMIENKVHLDGLLKALVVLFNKLDVFIINNDIGLPEEIHSQINEYVFFKLKNYASDLGKHGKTGIINAFLLLKNILENTLAIPLTKIAEIRKIKNSVGNLASGQEGIDIVLSQVFSVDNIQIISNQSDSLIDRFLYLYSYIKHPIDTFIDGVKKKNQNNIHYEFIASIPEKIDDAETHIDCLISLKKQRYKFIQHNQLFAILSAIEASKRENMHFFGKLGTGQGKSMVFAALAYMYAKQGKRVAIFSCYDHLTERDHNQFKDFFEEHQIASAYIGEFSNCELDSHVQVVYTNLSTWINKFKDYIRALILNEKNKSVFDIFSFDTILLDEFDALVLDSNHVVVNTWLFKKLFDLGRFTIPYSAKMGLIPHLKTDPACLHLLRHDWVEKYMANWAENFDERPPYNGEDIFGKPHSYAGGKAYYLASADSNKKGFLLYPAYIFLLPYILNANTLIGLSGSVSNEDMEQLRVWYRNELKREFIFVDIPPFFYSGEDDDNDQNENNRKIYEIYSLRSDSWLNSIKNDITEICRQPVFIAGRNEKRPILVFGDTTDNENWFKLKALLEDLAQQHQLKFNTVIQSEKELRLSSDVVRNTTNPSHLTLASRIAGRGVDFKVRLDEINDAWGLHVLIAFSPEYRLWKQMIGRTARMDQKGTHSIISMKEKPILQKLALPKTSFQKEFNILIERLIRKLILYTYTSAIWKRFLLLVNMFYNTGGWPENFIGLNEQERTQMALYLLLTNEEIIQHEKEINIPRGMLGDGHAYMMAFDLTPEAAQNFLITNIELISTMLCLPIQQALLTQNFFNYIIEECNYNISAQKNLICDDDQLRFLAADNTIQIFYIRYITTNINWPHPKILQVLAHLLNIELYIWRKAEESNVEYPYRVHSENYDVYTPLEVRSRVDLLFHNERFFTRKNCSLFYHPSSPLDEELQTRESDDISDPLDEMKNKYIIKKVLDQILEEYPRTRTGFGSMFSQPEHPVIEKLRNLSENSREDFILGRDILSCLGSKRKKINQYLEKSAREPLEEKPGTDRAIIKIFDEQQIPEEGSRMAAAIIASHGIKKTGSVSRQIRNVT